MKGSKAEQANEGQSHPYQFIVDHSGELFAIADAEYRYVFVNETYAAWHGRSRGDIEGRHVAEILGCEYFKAEIQPAIDRCLAGQPQQLSIERSSPGQGPRQLIAHYSPVETPDGKSRQVVAALSDITTLPRPKTSRLDRHVFEMVGRTMRLGGWSLDLQSGRITWSEVAAEIHGMPQGYAPTLEEAVRLYEPDWQAYVRGLIDTCIEKGKPFDAELPAVTANGSRLWLRVTGRRYRDEAGNTAGVHGTVHDITTRRETETKLRQLLQIVSQSPAPIVVTDTDGRIQYVNPSFEATSGYSQEDLVGQTQKVIQSGYTPEATYQQLWETLKSGRVWTGEIQNRRKNGELYWEFEVISPVVDDQGRTTNYVAIKEDITDLKETLTELRTSREHLTELLRMRDALINSLPAHIALLDAEGNILDVNEQWREYGRKNESSDPAFGVGINYLDVCEAATGDSREEAQVVAARLREVLVGERDRFDLEYPCHDSYDHRWFRITASRLTDDRAQRTPGAVVIHTDISERRLAELELDRLAYQDALTRLRSRNGFLQRLDELVAEAEWCPDATLVLLDVQGLHDINDTLGHETGDAVLIELGCRLLKHAPAGSVVGRTGGDEFAVFLPQRDAHSPTAQRATLQATIEEPFNTEDSAVELLANYGYTTFGDTRRPAHALLREAELALFHNRSSRSPDRWSAYTPELERVAQDRVRLTQALRAALHEHQLELHFQPKVDLETGRLDSAEALLRWVHPEQGLISPGVFIPVAEQSQLIRPIGDWVVREACRCLRAWKDADLSVVQVAANVSVAQFRGGDFARVVRDAMHTYQIGDGELSLEITESVFEDASEQLLNQIREIRDLGVRLSLDDFGTGYSSLLHLEQYPFDEIKIDQGFVRRMGCNRYSAKIVEVVLAVAQALDVEVVAEGIEDLSTRDALLAMGCRRGQGFYYSVPLAEEDFHWLLGQRSTLPVAKSS